MVTQLAYAFEQGTLTPNGKVQLVVESGGKEGAAAIRLNIKTNSKGPTLNKTKLAGF